MLNRLLDRPHVCIGLITLTTLVAYIPAYRAGFIWDDDRYVTRNPTLQSADGLRRIWLEVDSTPQYYPLAFTTFWIENHLWGVSPVGYHVVNVLLHVGGAILLWRLLLLLAVPGALLAAMLFALHPMHVESVAWITERKNVLSGFLYLAAMLAYFRWDKVDDRDTTNRGSWKYHVLAIALFLCALLSKSVTATLPAAILLILWWKRGRLTLRTVAATVPFFVAALAMALLTITIERHHVGTEKYEWGLGPIERFLIAGHAACFYLGKLIWPANLTFIYPRWQIDPTHLLQFVYPVVVIVALGLLFTLRRRIGRGPLTAALFYLGTLLPALGFVMVYPMRFSFVADHFCYLAAIGPIVLVSALCASRCGRPALPMSSTGDHTNSIAPVWTAVAAIVLCGLGVLTWRQSRIYSDTETLWRDTVAKNPDAWIAQNNLGTILSNSNRLEDAIEHFKKSIELFPDYPEAYNNLGDALLRSNRLDEAVAPLHEALQRMPTYLNARFNLGRVRERQGRVDDAIAEYRSALTINSYFAPAYLNLAQLMIKQGKTQEAAAELDRGLLVFGDRRDAALLHKAKAGFFTSSGNWEDAIGSLKEAVRLLPRDADLRMQLANTLFQAGKLDEAASAYVETLALNPNLPRAHFNIGVIRVSQGRPDEGRSHFQEAVRLKPDYAEARFNLGQLMEVAGRPEDAAREYRDVLRLAPKHTEAQQRLEALTRRPKGTTATTRSSM